MDRLIMHSHHQPFLMGIIPLQLRFELTINPQTPYTVRACGLGGQFLYLRKIPSSSGKRKSPQSLRGTQQQLRGLICNRGMNRTHGDLFILCYRMMAFGDRDLKGKLNQSFLSRFKLRSLSLSLYGLATAVYCVVGSPHVVFPP